MRSSLPSLQDLSEKVGPTDQSSEDLARPVSLSTKGPLHALSHFPPRGSLPPPVPYFPLAASKSDAEFPSLDIFESSAALFPLLKSQSNSAHAIPQWNISNDQVPTLPQRHPLEMTAVFVPRISNASEVATRVSLALERYGASVSAYNNSKAKASCMSSGGVDFRVRLYRGKDKFAHGIIVEIQRSYGFSPDFHFDALAILDEVEGRMTPTPKPKLGLPENAPRYALIPLIY